MRDILGISLDRSVRDPADCHRERLGCAIGVLEHAVGQCEARRVLSKASPGKATAGLSIRARICLHDIADAGRGVRPAVDRRR